MIKSLRALCAALFMLSVLSISCCRNNWGDNCYPCGVPSCSAPCQPCGQPCAPVARPIQDSYSAYPASCPIGGQVLSAPCGVEENPFCPCDPTFCGGGGSSLALGEDKCYRGLTTYRTCDDCVVDLCQVAPEFATVGSAYPIQITITARKECANVFVVQKLPCDSEFIRSEPCSSPNSEGKLEWNFDHLVAGESRAINVWVKPTREGCCLAEATVCACPQLCAYTKCGQPVICIKKYGPACACLYCPIAYCIEVCNSGSATAYDVVVQDNVPDGLAHSSGYNCLTYQLGNLCPGESKKFTIDFCANKRGMVTNVATVSYCGGPKCSAEASTLINQPCVEVTKTGPDWAYICKIVDYTITVTNPGDLILRDVVVDDVGPAGTTVVEAPGAEICCNRAVWCVPELCPGETMTFHVSVRSQVAGCLVNKVTVTSQSDCGQCTMCAEAPTCWKGIPATHMCMVDTVDPICVGETTVYRICITNRGTADDTNVSLQVRFSPELQPMSVNGPTPGTINGDIVTFAPFGCLASKQCIEYAITVKGVRVGDAEARAELISDTLPNADIDVERTHVY